MAVSATTVHDGNLLATPNSQQFFGLEPEDDAGQERQFIIALARGLEVLRCFRPGDRLLGNKDIAKRSGLPRPTVCRLTYITIRL